MFIPYNMENSASKTSKKEKSIFWQAVGLVFQFGYTIIVPLVILVLAGRLLDKKFNSSPIFLLTGIIVSVIISGVALLLKMKKILAKMK